MPRTSGRGCNQCRRTDWQPDRQTDRQHHQTPSTTSSLRRGEACSTRDVFVPGRDRQQMNEGCASLKPAGFKCLGFSFWMRRSREFRNLLLLIEAGQLWPSKWMALFRVYNGKGRSDWISTLLLWHGAHSSPSIFPSPLWVAVTLAGTHQPMNAASLHPCPARHCCTDGKRKKPLVAASPLQEAILGGEESHAGCAPCLALTPLPSCVCLSCAVQRTQDATGSLWLLMPILGPQVHFCPRQGFYIPAPLRWKLSWMHEDLPREGRVEVPFSSTLGAMLRSSNTDSGCWDLVRAQCHTLLHHQQWACPRPRHRALDRDPLKGWWALKKGRCVHIPNPLLYCLHQELSRPRRSLGNQ